MPFLPHRDATTPRTTMRTHKCMYICIYAYHIGSASALVCTPVTIDSATVPGKQLFQLLWKISALRTCRARNLPRRNLPGSGLLYNKRRGFKIKTTNKTCRNSYKTAPLRYHSTYCRWPPPPGYSSTQHQRATVYHVESLALALVRR